MPQDKDEAGYYLKTEKPISTDIADSAAKELKNAKPTCGNCKQYFYYTAIGPVEGYCQATPGKRGAPGKSVRFDQDAAKCPKYDAMEEVITDGRKVGHDQRLRYGDD